MDRRDTVLALLALGAAPLAAEAQQAGKVFRIGVLLGATSESTEPLLRAFTEGLRDLGYVEERDFVFERRYAGGRLERLPELEHVVGHGDERDRSAVIDRCVDPRSNEAPRHESSPRRTGRRSHAHSSPDTNGDATDCTDHDAPRSGLVVGDL